MTFANIKGVGAYIPPTILTNKDVSTKCPSTNEQWILEKTGIRERRITLKSTDQIATLASESCLKNAGLKGSDIDLIISLSTSPEYLSPAVACIIQKNLNSNAMAFDMNSVCSSGIAGLITSFQFIQNNTAKRVLITCSEATLKDETWDDRSTCIFFGDGAGSVILESSPEPGIISHCFHTDGKGYEALLTRTEDRKLTMDGKAVYLFATKAFPEIIKELASKANISVNEIDLIIPHQANLRILEHGLNSLSLPRSKLHSTVEFYGNTISASIFITLNDALEKNIIKKGNIIALIGFGGGLSWGGVLIKI